MSLSFICVTGVCIFGAVDPEEVVGAPEDPVSVEEPGPVLHLRPVDAGSSPADRKDEQVALVLHLDEAVLVLENWS